MISAPIRPWPERDDSDGRCKCGAKMYLANPSWIECVNPYCTYPEGSVRL